MYILTSVIVVLLIIVTVLLVIFVPKPICYFDIADIGLIDPLSPSETDECLKTSTTTQLMSTVENQCKIHDALYQMPKIYEYLLKIPNAVSASIVCIDGKTSTKQKKGTVHDNDILQILIPIVVCPGRKGFIWCDGEKRLFTKTNIIVYDPSRESQITNKHRNAVLKLLAVNIKRPTWAPKGVAN